MQGPSLLLCVVSIFRLASAHDAAANITGLTLTSELTLSEVSSWVPTATELLHFNGSNPACVKQTLQLLRDAERLDPQALHVLDSWAKIPSGVLRGNMNQLGDFDQCVNAGGRYCLVTVDFRLPPSLAKLDYQMHAHYAIKSTVHDPGHRLPRFSVAHWAVCLPEACSPPNLQEALEGVQMRATARGVSVQMRVDPDLCHCRADNPTTSPMAATLGWCLIIGILLLCILGTMAEMIRRKIGFRLESEKHQNILEAFSLNCNLRSLLDTTSPQNEVACLHGVRALNALGLLLSHKQMALMFLPYTNRTDLAQVIGKSWSMIGRSAILYTDSFILLSGLLSARSFLRHLSHSHSLNFKDTMISRLVRLTPCLAALIVFCSVVLPSLGSGPMWGLLINKYASLCHRYWWRNILYIHNHFPFSQMCLTHSHQVGIDMQLFLLSPLLVYVLWRRPIAGGLVLLGIAVWSSVLRFTVALSENLATLIYYGVPISQLLRTAEKTYILPSHRATVYCLGIALGYFFHRCQTCTLSHVTVVTGWIVGVGLGLLSMFAPYHMSWPGYVYNPQEAALYNTFAPILWSLFVGWAVFASHYGYGGWFGHLLGWRWFSVVTRLSYAIYLTQFPIFFYSVGQTRTSQQYSFFTLINLPEFTMVLVASVVLTLTIDLPAQNLKKVFLPSVKVKNIMVVTKEENHMMSETATKDGSAVQRRKRLPGSL